MKMQSPHSALSLTAALVASLVLAACGSGHDHKKKMNTAPVAQAASFTTQADTPLTGSLMGTDAEMDKLTFTVSTQPTQGSLTLNADGSFTYTPNADVTGMDEFTFAVADGQAISSTARVSINIDKLAVNMSDYTRQAFAQAPSDKPLSLNSRAVNQDVSDPHAFDDLLTP